MGRWDETQIVLFEDEAVTRLRPPAATRPVFELVAGAFTLRRRITTLSGQDPAAALVRPQLVPLLPRLGMRDFRQAAGDGPWTFINGSALLDAGAWQQVSRLPQGEGWLSPAGRMIAFRCDDMRTIVSLSKGKTSPRDCGLRFRENDGVRLIGHLWELIAAHETLLGPDLVRLLGAGDRVAGAPPAGIAGSFLEDAPGEGIHVAGGAVFVREGAEILPPVACDARGGPILIGRGAQVKPFSRLEGPLVVGEGTIVLGGRIAGSYLGPGCRVHGEVADSVLLGWTNKAHAGFLGHSYLGEWVNLGAQTTNSNLKNTYGTIRCWEEGELRDTERLKLGAFLGDHVRTGIGTLLDSGCHIGTGASIAGAAGVAPKWIPPFVWGAGAAAETYDWPRFAGSVARVMARRERAFDAADQEILKQAFEESAGEREAFLRGTAARGR
jgi:UDP-N-acetylglucosamine diphosphorylase/glucosamine-1-phosphate N-acetyltransferase